MKTRSERGQSLVELAISLVVLFMLLSGAVEYGMAFFQFIQLRDAAQEGALYGSLYPNDINGISARVRGASDKPINLGDTNIVSVVVTKSGSGCVGDGITVRVSYNHVIFMPFATLFARGPTIPLNAEVTDTILNSSC